MNAPDVNDSPDTPVSAAEAATLFAELAREARLLIAVSGGPDSVALLALLAEWAREPGRPALHAATVDHGLRPSARAEAEAVGRLCAALDVPHTILSWQGEKPRAAIQRRARDVRYALLAEHAAVLGGAVLVTAHTRDDQAETLMMRLARGSGPSGLAGMRGKVRRGAMTLMRPLLSVPKARLVATAAARKLAFAQDPSNADPRFERARWRALMPVLAAEGLTAERLALLAARLARMDEAIAQRVACLLPELWLAAGEGGCLRMRFAALAAEPDEILLRGVAAALERATGRAAADWPRLERLEACAFALRDAARQGAAIRRTLSGCVLSLGRDGVLTLTPEPIRRRGIHPAS